jgi:hypothetical protein
MDIEGIKTSLVTRDTALKRPLLGKTKKIIEKDWINFFVLTDTTIALPWTCVRKK